MDNVSDYLARVREADTGLTGRETMDTLWLAAHMTGFRGAGLRREYSRNLAGAAGSGTGAPAVSQESPSASAKTDLLHPAPAADDATPTGKHALPVRLPDPRELRRPLDLQRALRPLARTVDTGPPTRLDEEATATQSAEADTVIPALARSSERWLNLAVVVDTSPSMTLWGNLITEVVLLLTQLGAFRTIRTWHFRFDGGKAGISPPATTGRPRSPKEIVDPAGRQAFLIISDCVCEPWLSGTAMEAVDTWARTGPLAIVQPLSQQLWSRSAVECHYVQLHSPFLGAPNHRLTVDTADDPGMAKGDSRVPVPVLEIGPRWFASWAQLISGSGRAQSLAAFTGPRRPGAETITKVSRDTDPKRLVERFMAGASADAFRLAGLLAAAPLALPVMRHIQRVMLPGTRPQELAEVYLSGLLQTSARADRANTSWPATFEFLPGVRDLLLGTIRRSEAIRVRELVSAEINRPQGPGHGGFTALVGVGSRPTARQLTTADIPYSEIEAHVLWRIGGRYEQVARGDTDLVPGTARAARPIPETSPVKPTGSALEPDAEATASSVLRLAPPTAAGRRLEHGITMLGAPSSGKSTFLAALSLALTWRGGEWKVIPSDDASAQALINMVSRLTVKFDFPIMTWESIELYRWMLFGRIPHTRSRRRGAWQRDEQEGEPVRIDMRVSDPPGEITKLRPGSELLSGELVRNLLSSRAIVFLFDPVREFEHGDAFDSIFALLARLSQHMSGSPECADGRLPHFVAVCVSKFDDDRVLASAGRLGLLTTDPDDPYGFPRVADSDARELFSSLCDLSLSGTADLVISTLEKYFRPDRVKYFVTSGIGFYVSRETGSYDPADHANYVRDLHMPEKIRIRGAVHPINVAEPLIWLGSRLATESME